jgi:hypothetical protein
VRQELPAEWARFLNPADAADAVLDITLPKDRFPFAYQGRRLSCSHDSLNPPGAAALQASTLAGFLYGWPNVP